jgi:hypothetical protein
MFTYSDLNIAIFGLDLKLSTMKTLCKALVQVGVAESDLIRIISTPTFAIEFVDSLTKFHVNISFDEESCVRAAHIMNGNMERYRALRYVICYI